MFERLALYGIVTDVGNAKTRPVPVGLYAKKGDSWQAYQRRKAEYESYKSRRDRWFGASASLASLANAPLPSGHSSHTKIQAARFFIRSSEWAEIFYKDCYGSKEHAYEQTESKEDLAYRYVEWFAEMKNKMRKSMNVKDKQEIKSVVEASKTEVSVYKSVRGNQGGVANLLKVLTKTMERQGADIRSIAKVQYAICKQAGIMIPDEFIEDVATVLYAEATPKEAEKEEM